ncbi:flavin reductase family protein [Streptomyces sp. NPDC002809]|uniref:flavin reductase family protein n=1 Tax=Streptomyces sp. NPDC002809 TaxID=3154433 RepID=UPI003330B6DD
MTLAGLDRRFGTDAAVLAPAVAHSDQVRAVFGGFPAAVVALCAVVDGAPYGMVATSLAVGVSYDPPMALFSARNDSSTWPVLRKAGRIGASVLAEHQGAACRQLAAKDADRFAGLSTRVTGHGPLFVEGASSWMDCEVVGELAAGDHTVITFRIHQVGQGPETPLLFHDGRFPRMRHEHIS